MTTFERDVTGFRNVETNRGDSLRRIALRELGDATQWVEIALLNGLRPPYLVDDESERAAGVAVAGDVLRVPAPAAVGDFETSPDLVFGRDLILKDGLLAAENGDLALVAGLPNFLQALRLRLTVVKRDLGFHPEYGCWVSTLIGRGNGPAAGRLAAFYVRSALLEDECVREVPRCVATIAGDVIRVDADVVPISGRSINFSTVI